MTDARDALLPRFLIEPRMFHFCAPIIRVSIWFSCAAQLDNAAESMTSAKFHGPLSPWQIDVFWNTDNSDAISPRRGIRRLIS